MYYKIPLTIHKLFSRYSFTIIISHAPVKLHLHVVILNLAKTEAISIFVWILLKYRIEYLGSNSTIHQICDLLILFKVKRCFYNDFFAKNGAPMLTKLFCAVDNKWFGVLDPMHHGIKYPTLNLLSYFICLWKDIREMGLSLLAKVNVLLSSEKCTAKRTFKFTNHSGPNILL